MKNVLNLLDPATYGLNRAAIAFGIVALTGTILIAMKLLTVLHAAGMK